VALGHVMRKAMGERKRTIGKYPSGKSILPDTWEI